MITFGRVPLSSCPYTREVYKQSEMKYCLNGTMVDLEAVINGTYTEPIMKDNDFIGSSLDVIL